jgi:hypothetical protein
MERDHFADLGTDGRKILKCVLVHDGVDWIQEQDLAMGSCEQGNECSRSIESGVFLD